MSGAKRIPTDDVVDAVREDPDLRPFEKETTVRFAKDDDRATVVTEEAGMTRRLLQHPETSVRWLRVLDGDVRATVDPESYESGAVVGCYVTVPVGALKIQLSPRASGGHADVVSSRVLETPGGESA